MKRVSFEVAKALKEAGYPQGETDSVYVTKDIDNFEEGELVDILYTTWVSDNVVDAPYAVEVWFWLWREKKICINCNLDKYNLIPQWWCNNEDGINYNTPNFDDPEEAIVATIEGLVENHLIK